MEWRRRIVFWESYALFAACAVQAQVSTNAVGMMEEDIRDIRGPIHIPYSWIGILYIAGALAVLGFLIWAWRFWKNRSHLEIPRLPHEIALERLEKARVWMNGSNAREFSIAVSDAVRLYIEDRFQERAAHRTTNEFLHHLLARSSSPLTSYAPSLDEFLQHCDLAKFARWQLAASEMEAMHASAMKFVEETRTVSRER